MNHRSSTHELSLKQGSSGTRNPIKPKLSACSTSFEPPTLYTEPINYVMQTAALICFSALDSCSIRGQISSVNHMEVSSPADSAATRKWKDIAPLLFIAALAGLYLPTVADLFDKWTKWTESLSHGLLLIGIFLYFVCKDLPFQTKAGRGRKVWLTSCGLLCTSLLWALFASINLSLLAELCLVGILFLTVANLYGFSTAWQKRFLLAMPIFTLTAWDHLNGGLVSLSASVVGYAVGLLNIPAVIDGSSIFIPFGHIVIADGCSGMRYLIIALAIGYLIGYLNDYSEKYLIPTLAIAALLALATNWLRIFILILVGYKTEMQSSLMHQHDTFGWILFALVCMPALYLAPVRERSTRINVSNLQPSIRQIAVTFLLLSTGPIIYWLQPTPTRSADNVLLNLPTRHQTLNSIAGYKELAVTLSAEEFPPGIQQIVAVGDAVISINNRQRLNRGQKLVPYLGELDPQEQWSQQGSSIAGLPVAGSAAIVRNKIDNLQIAQIRWFQVGNYHTADSTSAKLLQLPALITGNNTFRTITLRQFCQERNCTLAFTALAPLANEVFTANQDQ